MDLEVQVVRSGIEIEAQFEPKKLSRSSVIQVKASFRPWMFNRKEFFLYLIPVKEVRGKIKKNFQDASFFVIFGFK